MRIMHVKGGAMRLEWIDDILAVLDAGSLARAAERRFLTQSAFTRRVRLIEQSVGAELFDRRRKPVTLRPGVAAMEPELRDLAARLRRVQRGLKATAEQGPGALCFACQHAITTTVSPWIVRALTRDGAGSVRVRSGNQDECLVQLLAGEADFAVMYGLPGEQAPLLVGAVDVAVLGHDMLIAVGIPALRAAAAGGPIPAISYPSDVFLGQIFDRNIAPRLRPGLRMVTKAETALTLAALQFALSGIGIAWLPQSLVAGALAAGQLVRLDGPGAGLPSQALEVRVIRLSQGQTGATEAAWHEILTNLDLSAALERLPDQAAGLVEPVE